jgi:hypothetical protein
MHHALLLPEIVATILQNGKTTEGLLFTSLFVNRLFFREATRILWYGCGTDWNSATAGHVTPDIRHLGQIVEQSAQRAQIYANLIHVLQFRDEGELNGFADEARWHQKFLQLDFPALEQVDLYPSEDAITLNTGEVVLHYAQSNLKRLGFHAGSQLDNSFLNRLCERCPRLQELILTTIKGSIITKEELAAFLKRTIALQNLQISAEFQKLWTQQAFETVSMYQNLGLLHMHHIEDSWITAIDRNGVSSVFPNLKHLYAGVLHTGLELLHRFIPKLRGLTLENEELGPSHQILLAASRFTALTELKIQLGEASRISSQELVQLARNCPKLRKLSIAEDQSAACIPSASGITDELMENFARNAPYLHELCLIFNPQLPVTLHSPTFQSLRSLGRHCPDLIILTFFCSMDWDGFRQSSSEILFSELWFLKLFGLHSLDTDDEDVVKDLAKKLMSISPKLMDFSIDEPTEAEELLEDAVTHMCYGIGVAINGGDDINDNIDNDVDEESKEDVLDRV